MAIQPLWPKTKPRDLRRVSCRPESERPMDRIVERITNYTNQAYRISI